MRTADQITNRSTSAAAVLSEVLEPTSGGFDDRLEKFAVPEMAGELAGLAHEVAKHTGHRLVVMLDNGERLSEDDRALLAELASIMNPSVRLVVCINSTQPDGAETVRLVEARDAVCHRIGALNQPAIHAWLEAEGIPRAQWDTIVHLSSGYPFFIDAAIRLTRDGASLAELKSPRSTPRTVLHQIRLLVRPDTVLRWHRDLIAAHHARLSSWDRSTTRHASLNRRLKIDHKNPCEQPITSRIGQQVRLPY